MKGLRRQRVAPSSSVMRRKSGEAVSALALGLLASAAVSNAAQAALALPMICFPQVLFAGGLATNAYGLASSLSLRRNSKSEP